MIIYCLLNQFKWNIQQIGKYQCYNKIDFYLEDGMTMKLIIMKVEVDILQNSFVNL